MAQHIARMAGLLAVALALPPAVVAQEDADSLAGIWQGVIQSMGFELRIVVHVTADDDGEYHATITEINERIGGIPVDRFSFVDGTVEFGSRYLNATFEGQLARDEPRRIEGHWQQGRLRARTVLRSVASIERPRRPQEPRGRFPYRQQKVAFSHVPARGLDASFRPSASVAEDAVTLAGTLTLPVGEGPHPAVALISGSGAHDRNGTVRAHRPFFLLADHLTRRGLAVLRYDDRGTAESTGVFAGTTSADMAVDARAALRYLHTRDDIDRTRIGLIGHSEGGMVAAMVAAGPDAGLTCFIISLAGPSVNGEDLLIRQANLVAAARGTPAADLDTLDRLEHRLFEILRSMDDPGQREAAMSEAARKTWPQLSAATRRRAHDEVGNFVGHVLRKNDPWVRFIASYDPGTDLRRVTCPTLILIGAKDLLVDPDLCIPVARTALAAAGNTDFTVRELPDLNHLFQTCTTGGPEEYFVIEETLAPAALDAITEWLRERGLAK